MFRVEISDEDAGKGAHHTADSLGEAVLYAVMGSQTYTPIAFMVSIIVASVLEEVFDRQDHERLKDFLRKVKAPENVREALNLALKD